MLAREFVYAAGRGCIGDIKARLRERIGRPDICERTTTAMCDPKAGILRVPTSMRIRIRSQVGAIRVHPLTVTANRSVASEKTYVIHQGILAGHPHGAHRTAVDPPRVKADAGSGVVASARGLEQRPGRTGSLKSGSRVENVELRLVGMEAYQHAVGA